MTKQQLRPWLVCGCASLFFFYEFIQGNMFASINEEVMQAFNTDIIGTSWMSSMYYLANVVFLLPAGILLDRYSTKRIILSALMVCIIGTFLFAQSSNYTVGLACRFMTGIGSAFCFLSCFRLASRWFPAKKMALVTGCIVTLAMSGGMVAQGPITYLSMKLGWRQAIMLDGLLGLLIFACIQRFVADEPQKALAQSESTSTPLTVESLIAALRICYGNRQNLMAALYTSLMNMPVAVLGAFIGSVYLMQAHHYLRTEAASINSMIFLGTIIGGPLLGHLSDRLQLRKLPMIICGMLSMLVVVAILYMSNASVLTMSGLFFLLGFFSSAQVISYPLVSENSPATVTATAVSVVSMMTQTGFIIYQNLFSAILHHQPLINGATYSSESYRQALMLIPYGFVIALFSVFLLRETFCKRIEDR